MPMQLARLRSRLRQLRTALRIRCRLLRRRMNREPRRLFAALMQLRARSWQRLYALRYRVQLWKARQGTTVAALVLVLIFALSALWISALRDALALHFATDERLDALRSLFLTLGGALVGAAAIVDRKSTRLNSSH